MPRFDAILFDAGGIFVLPDPTVLGPLLAYFGGDPSVEARRRAHYRAMAVKSATGKGEAFWDEYNHAYVATIGVHAHEVAEAAAVLGSTRTAHLWRWPIPESVAALRALHDIGTPVRVVIDSHVVGVAKPDPAIFDHALPFFEGIARQRIAYVGDSVTMDIGGARAAGLHPILLDPHDDHPGADFERIISLEDLL